MPSRKRNRRRAARPVRFINDLVAICKSLSPEAWNDRTASDVAISVQHDLRTKMLEASAERRLTHLRHFVEPLQNSHCPVSEIAKMLLTAECWLSDVIRLKDASLTRAFLHEKESVSWDESQRLVPPEVVLLRNLRLKSAFPGVDQSIVDGDSRTSVDLVQSTPDDDNAKVIFKHGPCKYYRVRYFFDKLKTVALKPLGLQTLKMMAEQAIRWNILDDEASKLIELEMFQKAKMDVIQTLLLVGIDAHVTKLFSRNVVTAVFGNSNVNLAYLKALRFDLKSRGHNDFTALHYAMQNCLYDKVQFLLDRGADPNLRDWRNETPLLLSLHESLVNRHESKRCAELLLQYGADPFVSNWEGIAFDSVIRLDFTKPSRFLMQLAMAYCRMYRATGGSRWSIHRQIALKGIDIIVVRHDFLFNYYMKCKHQINVLRKDCIGEYRRENLTMFTIISRTGDKLFRMLNEKHQRRVTEYMLKYEMEGLDLVPYYRNALKEHMRQFRRLVSCKQRLILVLSESIKLLSNCRVVLEKIVSYVPISDLLLFDPKTSPDPRPVRHSKIY